MSITVADLRKYKKGTMLLLGFSLDKANYSLDGLDDYNKQIFGQVAKITRISKWSMTIKLEDDESLSYEFSQGDDELLDWLSILDVNQFRDSNITKKLQNGDSISRSVNNAGKEMLQRFTISKIYKQDFLESKYADIPPLIKVSFMDTNGGLRFWCSRGMYSYVEYAKHEFIECNTDKTDIGSYVLFFKDGDKVKYFWGSRGWKDHIGFVKKSPSSYISDLEVFRRVCTKYKVYVGKIVDGGIEKIDIA